MRIEKNCADTTYSTHSFFGSPALPIFCRNCGDLQEHSITCNLSSPGLHEFLGNTYRPRAGSSTFCKVRIFHGRISLTQRNYNLQIFRTAAFTLHNLLIYKGRHCILRKIFSLFGRKLHARCVLSPVRKEAAFSPRGVVDTPPAARTRLKFDNLNIQNGELRRFCAHAKTSRLQTTRRR